MKINLNLTESGHVGRNVTDLERSEARFAELPEFFPNAKEEDWTVEVAGERVQIIKKDPTYDGVLELGTELVIASDQSISHRKSGLVRAGARPRSSSIAHQHHKGDWANKEVGR